MFTLSRLLRRRGDGENRGPPSLGTRADIGKRLGLLTVVAVIVATVSGFSLLISALGVRYIRSYNRISVFIAFFALVAVAFALDWIVARVPRWHGRAVVAGVVCVAVLALGVVDQTSSADVPDYKALERAWDSDDVFMHGIQRDLGSGAAVFQLPYVFFPEAGSIVGTGPYDQVRGWLHADSLRWSWGSVRGREGDWQGAVVRLPAPEALDALTAVGFTGLMIDRAGYDDHGAAIEAEVHEHARAGAAGEPGRQAAVLRPASVGSRPARAPQQGRDRRAAAHDLGRPGSARRARSRDPTRTLTTLSGMSTSAAGTDPFAEDEDQQALRKLARDVAERDLAPNARHWDETEEFPDASWDALRKADLFGITVGEQYGGMGMGDIEAAIALEELARADVSSAILAQLIYNGPPRAIEHLGSDALKERWLPLAASGEALFCIGISESEAGSAVNHMRARLTPDGDGYRLNAYKNYVTGGHKAGACLVWCRFPGSEGSKGIGAVVVDLQSDGVTCAGTHVKMGLRGTSEAELAFDDVYVGPEDVLLEGDPSNSDAFKTLISHLNHERCGNAAMCVGAAQGALEYAVGYINERVVGGRPLAEHQGLQWKAADMATQLDGARLLLLRALHLAGPHGTPPALETAMAKAAANLAAKFVCDEAIQLLGGYGYSREFPVERAYRDIRGLCIGAGTVEIQRNYIGSQVVKGATSVSPGWRNPLAGA